MEGVYSSTDIDWLTARLVILSFSIHCKILQTWSIEKKRPKSCCAYLMLANLQTAYKGTQVRWYNFEWICRERANLCLKILMRRNTHPRLPQLQLPPALQQMLHKFPPVLHFKRHLLNFVVPCFYHKLFQLLEDSQTFDKVGLPPWSKGVAKLKLFTFKCLKYAFKRSLGWNFILPKSISRMREDMRSWIIIMALSASLIKRK